MKYTGVFLTLLIAASMIGCERSELNSYEPRDSISTEDESTADNAEILKDAKAEDYLGQWECESEQGYIFLAVSEVNGGYAAAVVRSQGGGELVQWEYPLKYKRGKLVCNGEGLRSEIDESKMSPQGSSYDLSDFMKTYPNQSAEFIMTSEGIKWNDLSGKNSEEIVLKFLQSLD